MNPTSGSISDYQEFDNALERTQKASDGREILSFQVMSFEEMERALLELTAQENVTHTPAAVEEDNWEFEKHIVNEEVELLSIFNSKIHYPQTREKILAWCKVFEEFEIIDRLVDAYMKKFLSKYPMMDKEEFTSSLQFAALCLALKTFNDLAIYNDNFRANIFSIGWVGPEKMREMELAFLKALDWVLPRISER